MDRRAAICLLVASLVLGAAADARADGFVRGEGYAFGLPDGFREMAPLAYADSPAGHFALDGGLTLRHEATVQTYFAGRAQRPDAVLLAARLDLKDDGRLRSARDLQRYVLDNLHVSREAFERLMARDRVTLTPRIHDGCEAFEMAHDGVRGPLALLEEPAVRAMAILGDGFVLVFVLVVTDDAALSPDEAWRVVTSALSVDPPGAFARSALRYGGIGLLGLLLLVLLLRFLDRRRIAQAPSWARVPGARGEADWGHSVLAPPLRPAGGRPSGAASTHGGLRLGPVPSATPQPEPSVPGPSNPKPAPIPVAGPAVARPGLKRTLPQGGRFSANPTS